MAEHIKHGPYIMELKTGMSIYKQVTSPQIGVSGSRDLAGANFSLGFSFLTQPFLMVAEAHKHDFDQIIFFLGGNPENVADFDAEIEMGFGEEKSMSIVNYPACVFIPSGTMHGPLNIKKVNQPFMFIDVTLSPGFSIRPVPDGSRRTP
jgi:hypothetical protein